MRSVKIQKIQKYKKIKKIDHFWVNISFGSAALDWDFPEIFQSNFSRRVFAKVYENCPDLLGEIELC